MMISADTESSITSDFSESQSSDSELVNIGIVIDQFAAEVVDVSSQFGSDSSISYTAHNILAKPTKYPSYGDFPETFAFRTYGNWWNRPSLKSSSDEFMQQNFPELLVDDFIVLQFEECVFPEAVRIYETYNPGAVIRIWAYTVIESWCLLWEADEDWDAERFTSRSRIFSPPINKISLPTRIIKLEFNHSQSEYFTEIDAVVLVGKKYNMQQPKYKNLLKRKQINYKGPIQKRLELVRFQPNIVCGQEKLIQEFFKYDFNKFVKEAGLDGSGGNSPEEKFRELRLNDLPYEILFKILSLLDLKSLFRVAQVNRTLYDVATDPLLYMEVNLKPYWNMADSFLMQTLTKRGTLMRKFDVSWCGLFNNITSNDLKEFLKQNGRNLTHLRLNCCKFLTPTCIETIGSTCFNLRELSLRNYSSNNGRELGALALLTNLERLDLFRCSIETYSLLNILQSNSHLKHLNVGLSGLGVNMDEVAGCISVYNKEMVSLDFWKSHSLTSIGLRALSDCHNLEEVDFGWCLREETPLTESLLAFLIGCPMLKKLFLTAVRGLTDRDLLNIANNCSHLEQLDLMGIFAINADSVEEILTRCPNLKLLDLSFCHQLDPIRVAFWRGIYDISIKRGLNHSERNDQFPFL